MQCETVRRVSEQMEMLHNASGGWPSPLWCAPMERPIRLMPLDAASIRELIRKTVAQYLREKDAGSPEKLSDLELFQCAQAAALKKEILKAGQKLWIRQYVDGNGGNISARICDERVVCTPTLCSKGDLREEDLSLVDLENRQLCGSCPQTSEILLHLQIYKAVPQARAVIHCHPPYATAHAVAGVIPPGNLIPEQEVFVGPVALAPYETPGTMAFARTILPFVQQHNTILLGNHGIVCWADSVTHAEWYVEVVETYCKTVMIASQLRSPLPEIPPDKILDLLAIKKRLGLPDARFPQNEGLPAAPAVGVAHREQRSDGDRKAAANTFPKSSAEEIDKLTERLTAELLKHLEDR
jgi:L-fuculose-phosphate aldolase